MNAKSIQIAFYFTLRTEYGVRSSKYKYSILLEIYFSTPYWKIGWLLAESVLAVM